MQMAQTVRSYTNGVDSKIIRNLKSRSLHVAELYSGFNNFFKVSHSTQAAYYFTLHGNFTLHAQYFLSSIYAPKLKLVATAVAWIEKAKNVRIGHVTRETFTFDLILQIFGQTSSLSIHIPNLKFLSSAVPQIQRGPKI